jgi:hypothetical protein
MESQNGGAVGINHVKKNWPGYKGKHSYNQHSYNQNFKKPPLTKSKSSPNVSSTWKKMQQLRETEPLQPSLQKTKTKCKSIKKTEPKPPY